LSRTCSKPGINENLVGKDKRKISLRGQRETWKDNIKVDLKKNRVWTGFKQLRVGSSGASCEHSNEPLTSIKGVNFSPAETLPSVQKINLHHIIS
jgi:hypothetical protein